MIFAKLLKIFKRKYPDYVLSSKARKEITTIHKHVENFDINYLKNYYDNYSSNKNKNIKLESIKISNKFEILKDYNDNDE